MGREFNEMLTRKLTVSVVRASDACPYVLVTDLDDGKQTLVEILSAAEEVIMSFLVNFEDRPKVPRYREPLKWARILSLPIPTPPWDAGEEVEPDANGLDRWHTWGVRIDGCFHRWTSTHRPSVDAKRDELAALHPDKTVVVDAFRLAVPRWPR